MFEGNMASLTALSKPNTSFCLALFKELADNDKTANIFYSPFSISSALAMVLLGAGGNTATQMREVGASASAPVGRSSRPPCRWPRPLQPGWQLRHFSRLLPKRRRASGPHGCVAEAELAAAWGVATCIFQKQRGPAHHTPFQFLQITGRFIEDPSPYWFQWFELSVTCLASSGCVTVAAGVAVSYQKVHLCELVYYNLILNQLLDKYCRSVMVNRDLTTMWKLCF